MTNTVAVPAAANDNAPSRPEDRKPGESGAEWLMRIRAPKRESKDDDDHREFGPRPLTPFETEVKVGRIPIDLAFMAEEIVRLHQIAREGRNFAYAPVAGEYGSPPLDDLRGAEIAVDADSMLRRFEEACGHLWLALRLALVAEVGMSAIGERYDAADRSSATVGREKVIDALRFAARCRRRIEAEEQANDHRFGLAA